MGKKYYVVGRGLAGWHAKGINVSSSGGDLDNGVYWTGEPTIGYRHEAVDGALIYDAIDADPDAFTRFIISGPMVDPKLPAGGVDRGTLAAMVPGLEAFLGLGVAALDPAYSGLDNVAVDVYRELLRAIPGIKLGTITGGVVVWESTPDPVVPYPAPWYPFDGPPTDSARECDCFMSGGHSEHDPDCAVHQIGEKD
jgi:hypothetical protein